MAVFNKEAQRRKRKIRIKKKVSGTSERPRIYVFKSNKYVYIGVTDDSNGKVLTSVRANKNIENASKAGEKIGKELAGKKIETAVFDRSGYRYHGMVKSVADGVRKSGIKM